MPTRTPIRPVPRGPYRPDPQRPYTVTAADFISSIDGRLVEGKTILLSEDTCWANGIGLSHISTSNSIGAGKWIPINLLAPDCATSPAHFNPQWAAGHSVTFTGTDGQAHERKIAATAEVGQIASTDTRLIFFEALPTTVKPAYVLPDDFAAYIGNGRGLPILCGDQERKALVYEVADSLTGQWISLRRPLSAARAFFHEWAVQYDSGGGFHLIFRDTAIIIGHFWGPTVGPSYFNLRQQINDAMKVGGSPHKLQQFSFTR